MERSLEILNAIVQTGVHNPSKPMLDEVEIFQDWLGKPETWDRRDGSRTRRELLARYLLVNAILDQGPDAEGVRLLLTKVTNALYRQEVRFLHEPLDFFRELGIAVEHIDSVHETIRSLRAEEWARINQSNASRYNLFMDNAHQTLSYAVFRWGVPLALPLVLDRKVSDEDKRPSMLLVYLRSYPSAEVMSRRLKDHRQYGLGKAIGDKAAHLYAKWLVHSFPILSDQDPGWGPFSFEVPFDSNAGRVLWRTGFFLEWATLHDYIAWEVVQPKAGKGGTDYIRVTNIRTRKSLRAREIPDLLRAYSVLVSEHLQVSQRSRTVEIQRIPLALLLLAQLGAPGELDDGLMHIGTQFCFNHAEPLCSDCPAHHVCRGYQQDRSLITDYRT